MRKFLALIMAVAMIATFASVVFAVDEADEITGDLTVTTFFNEKSNAVALSDNEELTISFNSKSNGTNNWDNFVVAIVAGVGDAYTGAAEEIMIVRADSWGWGGGSSDFVAPDGDGNKLAFETNISDWDAWKAVMQAGCDVTVSVAKTGDTLEYNATMGEYTVSAKATSGKALPETVYVFLTGENVALTGISTELTGSAPQTGFATIALAIAAVASGAYVVCKKH